MQIVINPKFAFDKQTNEIKFYLQISNKEQPKLDLNQHVQLSIYQLENLKKNKFDLDYVKHYLENINMKMDATMLNIYLTSNKNLNHLNTLIRFNQININKDIQNKYNIYQFSQKLYKFNQVLSKIEKEKSIKDIQSIFNHIDQFLDKL